MEHTIFDERSFRELVSEEQITHISTGLGVDDGETILDYAARELYEETNLKIDHVLAVSKALIIVRPRSQECAKPIL